jgi:hypothetical protein
MDNYNLITRLQLLQRRLNEMANDLGNLTDPEIVAVSEEADELILQLQLIRREQMEGKRKFDAETAALIAVSKTPEEVCQ